MKDGKTVGSVPSDGRSHNGGDHLFGLSGSRGGSGSKNVTGPGDSPGSGSDLGSAAAADRRTRTGTRFADSLPPQSQHVL
jgi:hypothetical protein